MSSAMKTPGALQVTTPSPREIVLTRVFNAPRNLVFDAYTKPELVKRWLGVFGGWTMEVCEIHLKVGGSYRYLWRGPDGVEMGMRGVYREIVRPERIVCTESFDEKWYPGGDALDTTTLVEQDGWTTLSTTVQYGSQEVRDAVLRSPMKDGVARGYDTLAELLDSSLRGGAK